MADQEFQIKDKNGDQVTVTIRRDKRFKNNLKWKLQKDGSILVRIPGRFPGARLETLKQIIEERIGQTELEGTLPCDPTKVFINYSRKDKEFAAYIADELQYWGINVFVDYEKIFTGELFFRKTGIEIEACDYFLPIISPRSAASIWVEREIGAAFSKEKEIIPILLEEVPSRQREKLTILEGLERVDFQSWPKERECDAGIEKLLAAIGIDDQAIRHREAKIPDEKETETPEKTRDDSSISYFSKYITDLIITADKIRATRPEQALYLDEQVLALLQEQRQIHGGDARSGPETEPQPEPEPKPEPETEPEPHPERVSQPEPEPQPADPSPGNSVQLAQVIFSFQGHTDQIRSLYFSPNGEHLASASMDKTIRLWDIENGGRSTVLSQRDVDIYIMAYSHDGSTIASASHDITKTDIRLWDVEKRKNTMSLTGHMRRVTSLAFAPDKAYFLASASQDGLINLWNLKDANADIIHLCCNTDFPQEIAFSFDGKLLVSALSSGTIVIWDVVEKKELYTLTTQTEIVKSLSFSPNDPIIAYGTQSKNIELWNIETRKHLNTFSEHQATVECTDFSPNGEILASGARDGSVKLWDVSTAKVVETLTGPGRFVQAVAYSPDGSLLAAASSDGKITIWKR